MGRISRRALLGGSALALAAATVGKQSALASETIRIIYTNDTHAHLESYTEGSFTGGGVARRKTVIDAIRQYGGNILLLDAGDIFQGTLYFNVWNGLADAPFFNALGYDAMTLGNHEFDKGPEVLADFLRTIRYPVVSANLSFSASSPLNGLVQPSIVKRIAGTTVGIIGLTTTETPLLASPGDEVHFNDHYTSLQGTADRLSRQGIAAKIGLTHIGFDNDKAVASQTNGIGVIVGGHSHTTVDPTPHVVQDAAGNPVLVVQAGYWGHYVGLLDVSFDENGHPSSYRGTLIPLTEDIPEDPGFVAALRPWTAGVTELRQRVAGSSGMVFDFSFEHIRSREMPIGNLVADVIVERVRSDNVGIAIMNGGGIRAGLLAGAVTYGQIIEVLPFGNSISIVDVTGAQLRTALENGVSQIEQFAGRFPQVSGIRFAFDPSRPAFNRVSMVEVKQVGGTFAPLDPSAVYRVATNDFMAGGGDGYTTLEEGRNHINSGLLLVDALIEHFQRTPNVTVALEGRIQQPLVAARIPTVTPAMITDVRDLWRPGDGLISLRTPIFSVV